MKTEEANKIIAEFMGHELYCSEGVLMGINGGRVGTSVDPSAFYVLPIYSKSLDALVPVWKKLNLELMLDFILTHGKMTVNTWECRIYSNRGGSLFKHEAITGQEAAAIATAKSIRELNK